MAIFEHGGGSAILRSIGWRDYTNDDLRSAIDSSIRLLMTQIAIDSQGGCVLTACAAYRFARELERRQLAAAPKINHEKLLERVDRECYEGRFEEDYPGQHPLSRRVV